MSLDVWLILEGAQVQKASSGIFVRKNGATVEIAEQEWNEMHPDSEPVRFIDQQATSDEVYSANITHNLTHMADDAGIYDVIWHPDKAGITKASQLVKPLSKGLRLLNSDPDRFRKFNSPNGWGDYEALMSFVEQYLLACIKYPEADVKFWG